VDVGVVVVVLVGSTEEDAGKGGNDNKEASK
jgi:hypothetical protein